MKQLLVRVIGRLIADAGVQALVVRVVNIAGDADLSVGQVGKSGLLAQFEYFRFEPGPKAFSLRIVITAAPTALRAQGPVLVEQGAVGVAEVLPAPVGMHDQARGGGLVVQDPLQSRGGEFFGHGRAHLPADHILSALVLESAQVSPGAVGQRQIRSFGDPHPVGLDELGLVEQPVGGAVQAVGGVGGVGDGVGVCESLHAKQPLAMTFFKIFNSCVCCRARARK